MAWSQTATTLPLSLILHRWSKSNFLHLRPNLWAKRKVGRGPRRSREEWRRIALAAVDRTVTLRGGAVVWPEVEGLLAHREGWIPEHIPELADVGHVDPHHLGHARAMLLDANVLARTDGKIGERTVPTFVDAQALQTYGRKTAVTREAGRKRRLYGTLLSWSGNPKLCGQVAERQVAATLQSLAGRLVWLDPDRGSGEVRHLAGTKVPGGPLDHAGAIAVDPARPNAGFIDFVIEVKNVRQTIYAEHREIYDLLWKAGHYPSHVPILIAPRVHWSTFVLFKAIGALAYVTTRQSYAGAPAISTERFRQVAHGLEIPHIQQLSDPDRPSQPMSRWFANTLQRPDPSIDGSTLLQTSAALWARAAPILAQPEFEELRKQVAHDRRMELYYYLLEELQNEGLAVDRLLPQE